MNIAAQKKDERYDVETHFGFGENWADYSRHIDEVKIKKAEEGLFKLVSPEQLKDKTFLDIGCGSGLHALAALRGGVKEATCVDIDPNSVRTARSVVGTHWPQQNFKAFEYNILSEARHDSVPYGHFDIVYSWGVLHHTGAMWDAITKAASYVKPGGKFVIALYKKTPFCKFWAVEKKIYTQFPILRWPLNALYVAGLCMLKILKGQNPFAYIKTYQEYRGMHFMTDVKDWLGGYPYESASDEEVRDGLEAMGFQFENAYNTEMSKWSGLMGSGCAEYVFVKKPATAA